MKTILWAVAGLVLIVLVVSAVAAAGLWWFDRQMKRESDSLLRESQPVDAAVITEADIQHLPEPVQRYMRYTGICRSIAHPQCGRATERWFSHCAGTIVDALPSHRGILDEPGRVRMACAHLHGQPAHPHRARLLPQRGKEASWPNWSAWSLWPMNRRTRRSLMRYFNELMWLAHSLSCRQRAVGSCGRYPCQSDHDRSGHARHRAIHVRRGRSPHQL